MKSLISVLVVLALLVGCSKSPNVYDDLRAQLAVAQATIDTSNREKAEKATAEKVAAERIAFVNDVTKAVLAATPTPVPPPTREDLEMKVLSDVVKAPGASMNFPNLGLYLRTGNPATSYEDGVGKVNLEKEKNSAKKELQEAEFKREQWRFTNNLQTARHEDEHKAEVKELHGKLEAEQRHGIELENYVSGLKAEITKTRELMANTIAQQTATGRSNFARQVALQAQYKRLEARLVADMANLKKVVENDQNSEYVVVWDDRCNWHLEKRRK